MKRWLCMLAVATFAVAAPVRAADVDVIWPAESQQVFRFNVRQILDSELIKKYALGQIKQAMEGRDAKEMLEDLGIDPLKDIDTISGGIWNNDPNNPMDTHGVIALRGKFNGTKLFEQAEKAAQRDGDRVSIVNEGDTKLVKVVVDNLPEPIYATMADENTIVAASDKKLVMAAVKAVDTKTKASLKPELAELIKVMDDKASMFYVSVSNGQVGDIPPNPIFEDTEKLKKQLEQLESTAMTLRVTGDVTMEMGMAMKTKEDAEDFNSTLEEMFGKVKAFLPFITMNAPQAKPIVDDLKNGMKTTLDGKTIKMKIKISGDSIGLAVGADD